MRTTKDDVVTMPNTPLNPDGVRAAEELMIRTDRITKINYLDAERIISAYLAVAQPEITSIEELEELPYGSLIQDVTGETVLRFDGPNYDWITGEDGRYRMDEQVNFLPARVLFRPKV